MAPLPALSSLLDRLVSTASSYLSVLARLSALFSLLDALSSQLADVLAFHGPEPPAGKLEILEDFPDLTESVAARLRERLEGAMAELRGIALESDEDALEGNDSEDDSVSVAPTELAKTPSRTKKKESGRQFAPPSTFPALLASLSSQKAQLARLSKLPGATTHLDPMDTFGYSSRDCVEWIGELVGLCEEGITMRMGLVKALEVTEKKQRKDKDDSRISPDDIQDNWNDELVRDLLARIKERTVLAKAAKEAG
jgi:hypothetical protein